MNRQYIVNFHPDGPFSISVEITAENNQLALNQAQGMIFGEWIELVDRFGTSVRIKANSIKMLTCEEILREGK